MTANNNGSITPVILCGGSGSRLWPLSRAMRPKQFISVAGDRSLFQQTLARCQRLPNTTAPIVLCNEDHRFLAAEQLQEMNINDATIILEPSSRNTAPALGVAALQALKSNADSCLLILAADHLISDDKAFAKVVSQGQQCTKQQQLVTFGVTPRKPETGYGYIKGVAADGYYQVSEFVEKPDLATAQGYLDSGDYFWNSGMFMFQAEQFIKALATFQSTMLSHCEQALAGAQVDLDFLRLEASAYDAIEGISVDYAVMEKADNIAMVVLDSPWSDLGSWSSLWDNAERDDDNNAVHGDVLTSNVQNCYLYAEDKMIAAVGIQDLAIVETKDGVLVTRMDQDQQVKDIVGQLTDLGRSEATLHRQVFRPWGNYDSIDMGTRFQVKRICVKPGQATSLQRHYHRAEHWIVVSGCAEITKDDDTIILQENESVYIPVGTRHRIRNPGKIMLEFIEVQSGGYLGEDDIERFDDYYGREDPS